MKSQQFIKNIGISVYYLTLIYILSLVGRMLQPFYPVRAVICTALTICTTFFFINFAMKVILKMDFNEWMKKGKDSKECDH
ncbi:hypothetical protein [Enterococcus hulanensis]|uniref:hypothetical protein n=1 Tax=Enterococcus hulanensis TaxID=2559929 RepID=UPI0010F623F1|nr:hypothetical protein [Enterococcus hulanensis]